MTIHVVLFQPQIPNNTGNIGRLCVATNCVLHLIKPLGFKITDSNVKRSGLDYWPFLTYFEHDNFEAFEAQEKPQNCFLFSAHAKETIWDVSFSTFKEDIYLVFGREADGLPDTLVERHKNKLLSLPMFSENVRCYNLANAVAMSVMEVKRQLQ
jgi:tRNA (cytidine/uridine-2'-O-)-methyltransferase